MSEALNGGPRRLQRLQRLQRPQHPRKAGRTVTVVRRPLQPFSACAWWATCSPMKLAMK